MNKKISSEVALAIILLFSIVLGSLIYFSGKSEKVDSVETQVNMLTQQSEIETKTKAYYDNFRKKCGNSSCCLSSVDNAEKDNSLVYKSGEGERINCPDGFFPERLKCLESHEWCAPNKEKDVVVISDSIKNKCRGMECMPDCLDGWSETCFYDGNINKESDFKLGFKVEPQDSCFGINSVSVCGNCENKFEIKEGEKFIEISCEEFYQKIENKNKECNNCIKEIMTAS